MAKFYTIRRKLFFSWLISYLMILLIGVSVSSIVYFKVVKTMENEVLRSNDLLLSKLQKAGDSRLSDIRDAAAMIAMDKRVRSMVNRRDGYKDQSQEDILQVRNLLALVKSLNGFIDQVYIYFMNSDSAIDSNIRVNGELAFHFFHNEDELTYNQWQGLINKKYKGEFVPGLSYKVENTRYEVLSYFQSLPIEAVNTYLATVVIQINSEKFEEILQSVTLSARNTVFLMKNDTVTASTGPAEYVDLGKYAELKLQNQVLFDTLNNEKVVISFINSEIPGYRYVSVMPYGVFMEKSHAARNLMVMGLLLFILIGAFVSQLLVRKNYKPINNIIENIAKKVGMNLAEGSNELSFIHSVLNNTFEENDKFISLMKKHNNVLKSNFLIRLLKGRTDTGIALEETFENFDIRFQSQCFAVMLFFIESGNNNLEILKLRPDEIQLEQFILVNVVEELINQIHQGYMVELDDSILACIVNFREAGTDPLKKKQQLTEAAGKAQQFIGESFGISFSVSLSTMHSTLDGIPYAYREALHAMEHRTLGKSNQIICYDENANMDSFYDYSIETEYKLMNVIREGNVESAKKILDQIFERNFGGLSLSRETGECLVFDLLSTIVKQVDDPVLMDRLQPVSRLRKCNTLVQIQEEMMDVMEEICSYFYQRNRTRSDSKVSKEIIDYIRQNYQDQNLSVAMIGEHFNMTANYLSKLFKSQTGERLHDCIERLRIERAKELIKTENLNIIDIAKEVGYSSDKSFIRVFKKIEGMTPGKYKEVVS